MSQTQGRGGKRPGAGRKTLGTEPAVTVSVQLPPETLAKIDALATDEGKSRSKVILEILQVSLQ